MPHLRIDRVFTTSGATSSVYVTPARRMRAGEHPGQPCEVIDYTVPLTNALANMILPSGRAAGGCDRMEEVNTCRVSELANRSGLKSRNASAFSRRFSS